MKRIELHAKTKYSMDHESTIDIKNLILKCVENNEKGVAIVDKNSIISFYKAFKILKELDIKNFKLIYGVELKVSYYTVEYDVVILVKNKCGFKKLCELISLKNKKGYISLNNLLKNKEDLIIGLIYNEENYDDNIINSFDYLEVDKNVDEEKILFLKKKVMVIYSNRINAITDEEEKSKKILYNKLNIKKEIDNRSYQTTEQILNKINDKEIVIENTNKIFNMIESFDILDDEIILLDNNDFDVELLVYIKLNELFGDKIPNIVIKRVKEELKFIHDYNYDGFINFYLKIINKCKSLGEYVVCDYINYLYIAYLLGITHFDPIKLDLNYDLFFSNYPLIRLNISEKMEFELNKFIKEQLDIDLIRCKTYMKLNGNMLNKAFDKYEEKNNVLLLLDEKTNIRSYLEDYPISNNAITYKSIVVPKNYDLLEIMPYDYLINDKSFEAKFTNVDYKDIEHKFMTIELVCSDNLNQLNELKNITGDTLSKCNYKDKKIINKDEFKNYLKTFEKSIILDDLYEDLINSDIELYEVFNIINEIRNNRMVSKKTKNLLNNNDIKLKKYHDINFISRGILNEKTRLKYELLYFKEYYELDYYFVMLKDCYFNELIEIIKKGYDEVKKRINDYLDYQYEYKYLNLVKELYESKINFEIKFKLIDEDFYYELDKINNKILLIINKTNDEVNKYLMRNLSIIGTRPLNGKMSYLSKIIYKLLDDNKSITLFGFGGPINYYLEYLLSEITKLDRKAIHQYLNPCSCYKDEILSIDENKYFKSVKYLLNHNLVIRDYYSVTDSIIDKIDTLIDKLLYMASNSDVVIIDNIECIKEDIKIVLNKLQKVSKENNIKFIIFTNLKREYEVTNKKEILSFENYNVINKYFDYIRILDGEEIYEIGV